MRLGKLPISHCFAGKRLDQPLTGGYLYRCNHCHLKFRYPVQDADVYKELYNNTVTAAWPADSDRPDWELISGYILEHRPDGGRVLDFGCYSGGLLARMSSKYQLYGIEINSAAAEIAANHGRIWSSLEEVPQSLLFDAIIAADVVEHVKNPKELIEKFAALLAEDGVLIITTGDGDNHLWNRFAANWWYCYFPEHVAFISEKWITYLSNSTGVRILRCETFRYVNRNLARRFIDLVLMYCYGWFPSAFLLTTGFLKRVLRRPGITNVPGVGVCRDHLFVALGNRTD